MAFITSQQKWSNFSRNILIIAKQLMTVVDNSNISESINTIVYRSMKEKIVKYETVLKNIMEGQPMLSKGLSSHQSTPATDKSNILMSGGHPPPKEAAVSPASHSRDLSPNIQTPYTEHNRSEIRNSPGLASQSVSYNQEIDNSVSRAPRTLPVNVSLAPLDYDKIKQFLLESEDEIKV